MTGSDRCRFGRVEIRFDQRVLLADGQPLSLGARAFDLLEALVARRDRVVSKNELMDLVWPGVVVEENNLQTQVSTLRKLLGAQAIATIPGRGYRFVAPADGDAAAPVAAASPAAGAPPARAGEQARLLVADDNKVNRLLLARTLELQGHRVTTVDDGRAALERLRSERFELLLLDLEMPALDGYAVLEQIAQDAGLCELPVIVTSSVEGVAQVARCIRLGAEDFLHKPVNAVLLEARVASSLEKKRLRDRQQQLVARLSANAPAVCQTPVQRVQASVLAVGLHGIGALAAALAPQESIELLDHWQTLMLDAAASHGGVSGVPGAPVLTFVFDGCDAARSADAPFAAAQAALEMVAMLALFNAERAASGKPGVTVGIGIGSGSIVVGCIGAPRRAVFACAGEAVDRALELQRRASSEHAIVVDDATHGALAGRLAGVALGCAAHAITPR